MLASEFGFRKIIGVEYAAALCEIARDNLQRTAAGAPAASPVVIRCCDAAEYDFPERESVVYLFNPFDAVVLTKVLERLAASLERAPRKVWLIYMFPRWHEVIEGSGLFSFAGLRVHDECEFAIYIHEAS
jgi:hypothetical protein